MDNNFNNPQQFNGQPQQFNGQPQYYGQPKAPSNLNVLGLISVILSGVGFLMAILGTAFTCACSASKTYSDKNDSGKFRTSLIIILAIIGGVMCIVGMVLGILAAKQKSILAMIGVAVGLTGAVVGIIPTMTVCSYNCAANAEKKKNEKKNSSDDYDFDYDFGYDFGYDFDSDDWY